MDDDYSFVKHYNNLWQRLTKPSIAIVLVLTLDMVMHVFTCAYVKLTGPAEHYALAPPTYKQFLFEVAMKPSMERSNCILKIVVFIALFMYFSFTVYQSRQELLSQGSHYTNICTVCVFQGCNHCKVKLNSY